jgi:polyisoprenoid-binding protein YceI
MEAVMTAPAATREFAGISIPGPGTFTLDPAHTTASFLARHLMVSKVRGALKTLAGTITIAEDPLLSSVEVTLDAASIHTGTADRDNHLRSPDFLDVANYPTITFRSVRVLPSSDNEFRLVGELTIRDVTREVTLDVEFEGVVTSPYGKEVIGFTASTEIDREDFGLTWNVALEGGGVMVGKKVKIEIGAEAIRQA